MAFNPSPGFYSRQEQIDAQTTRMDNPSAVGNGYIHFGSMERLPASEALASNWQFATDGGEQAAFGTAPLGAAGAEWVVPPLARPAPPSAADRSNNWRQRGYASDPSLPGGLEAFAIPLEQPRQPGGHIGSGLGASSGSAGLGLASHQPLSQLAGSQSLTAHMQGLSLAPNPQMLAAGLPLGALPLGSLSLGSGAFPSALTVLSAQSGPECMPSCFMGSEQLAAPGAYLNPAGYGVPGIPDLGLAVGASAVGGCRQPPSSEQYHSGFMPCAAPMPSSLSCMTSAAAAAMRPPALDAEARRAGSFGAALAQQPKSPPSQGMAAMLQQASKAGAPSAVQPAAPQAAPTADSRKPLTQDDYAAAAKAWKPPKATTVLNAPSKVDLVKTQSSAGSKDWPCKRCSFINANYARFCEMCNFDRTGGDHDHGADEGWKSAAPKASAGGQAEQQPVKSRASAKNEKRRAKKASG